MRKTLLLLLAVFLVVGVFSSCGNAEADEFSAWYCFEDDRGEEIRLLEKPENVAVLFSSLADIGVLREELLRLPLERVLNGALPMLLPFLQTAEREKPLTQRFSWRLNRILLFVLSILMRR